MSSLMIGNVLAMIDNYGVEDGDNCWSNNILASDTIRLRSGAFGRRGDVDVPVDEDYLARARRLAEEIEALMRGVETGMGSEGGDGLDAFYACSTPGRSFSSIDEAGVSAIFGGALFPGASLSIAPISNDAEWWQHVEADCDGDDAVRARWLQLIAWFGDRSRFVEAAFVAVDHDHQSKDSADVTSGGCVFPRMWLGRTHDGALVGVLGAVVYT